MQESSVEELQEVQAMWKEGVKDLKSCMEKNDVKISRKDVMDKVAITAKQFKIIDQL
jgi:hypothetical protein